MSDRYLPEGGRVAVVMTDTGDGWESQYFEEFEQDAAEAYLAARLAEGGPAAVGVVLGFDFTPYAQDFGSYYDADGCLIPETEEEFRVTESRTSSGDLVSDAIESRWDDLVADAETQLRMGF